MSAIVLWSIAGTYTFEFIARSGSMKLVNIDIDSIDLKTGDFTAEARDENKSSRVWEVVGSVVGDKIELEFQNPLGEDRIVAVGSIDEDGNLAGRAANEEGEEFEWESTEGFATKLS